MIRAGNSILYDKIVVIIMREELIYRFCKANWSILNF